MNNKKVVWLAAILAVVITGCGGKKVETTPFVVTTGNFSTVENWQTRFRIQLTESEKFFVDTFLAKCKVVERREGTLVYDAPSIASALEEMMKDNASKQTVQTLRQGKEAEKLYSFVLDTVLNFSKSLERKECSVRIGEDGRFYSTDFLELAVKEQLSLVDSFVQQNSGQTKVEEPSKEETIVHKKIAVGETAIVRYKGGKLFLKVDEATKEDVTQQGYKLESKYEAWRVKATVIALTQKKITISEPFVGLTETGSKCVTSTVFGGVVDNKILKYGDFTQVCVTVIRGVGGLIGFYDPKSCEFWQLEI